MNRQAQWDITAQKRKMKKKALTLIMVMGMAFAANAEVNRSNQNTNPTHATTPIEVGMGTVFRTTQNLCLGTEQLMLYRSGTFELYDNGVEALSGTYHVDIENSVVVLMIGDRKMRCKFQYKSDRQNIACLTFRGNNYYPCDR